MHPERCCDTLLSGQQPGEVRVDFADGAVRARRSDAVAIRRARRAADEVIALVGSEYEERVARVDAVGL